MRTIALSLAALSLASCVGTPPIEKVAAEVEATGACKALPASVTCNCVVSTAHASIPTTKVERSRDDTGSRLGRGIAGEADPRIAAAIEAARKSCAAGKAVG